MSTIESEVAALIARARAEGAVITIDLVPREPLAMGNYEMLGSVRPARGAPDGAAPLVAAAPGVASEGWSFAGWFFNAGPENEPRWVQVGQEQAGRDGVIALGFEATPPASPVSERRIMCECKGASDYCAHCGKEPKAGVPCSALVQDEDIAAFGCAGEAEELAAAHPMEPCKIWCRAERCPVTFRKAPPASEMGKPTTQAGLIYLAQAEERAFDRGYEAAVRERGLPDRPLHEVLADLVNQIRKTSPVDDHGHDFKMNMAYLKAVKALDDPGEVLAERKREDEQIAREMLAEEYEKEGGDGPYPLYAKLARTGKGDFTLCSIRAIQRALAVAAAESLDRKDGEHA